MMNDRDIRWQQRFASYQKALRQLREAVELNAHRELSSLEKQGVIQAFEFTHELAWNLLKDYLQDQGNQQIRGSRDATREAFRVALITDGEQWMAMIQSRNLSSYSYGNLEKLPSGQFFKTRSENAISASLHFQSLRRLKMAGHPCPARAP